MSCWDGDYNQLANRRIVAILSEPLKLLPNALYIGSSIHGNIYGADADFRGRIVLTKVWSAENLEFRITEGLSTGHNLSDKIFMASPTLNRWNAPTIHIVIDPVHSHVHDSARTCVMLSQEFPQYEKFSLRMLLVNRRAQRIACLES